MFEPVNNGGPSGEAGRGGNQGQGQLPKPASFPVVPEQNDGMLQILNAINKAGNEMNHQPLHLDRTDINVVVDESFCMKTASGEQRWRCNVCPKYYATKNHLVTHLLGHYGVKPFACTVCNKTFNQETRLKFHMLSHSGNKGASNNGREHGRGLSKGQYTCSICMRSFTQMMYLKRHLLTHENKQPYCCNSCAKGFALLSELQAHLELHKQHDHDFTASLQPFQRNRKEGGGQASGSGLDNEDREMLASGGELRCETCGRKFLFPSQIKDHMLTHTQVRRYECEICKMKFLKVHHLKAHCLTHSNIRPHKCDLCGRSFTLKGNLIRHLLTHTKERAFECDICGKRFSQRQTLKTHLVIHADTKPFSCQVCGKALARAHNLKSHMALHRQEKPYKCPLCNSAFTMKGNLHRHYKEKHKDAIKTTLNLDTQKTGMALVLSSQHISFASGSGNRCSRMLDRDLQIENMFGFGMYSQSDLNSQRKRKRSPKKRNAAANRQQHQQHHQNGRSNQLPSQPIQVQPQQQQQQMQQPQQQIQQPQPQPPPPPPSVQLMTNMQPLGPFPHGAGIGQGGKMIHAVVPNVPPCGFHNSVLTYCNDSSCTCKYQGQIGTYSSAAAAAASSVSQHHHLMQKIHTLHSALDTIALNPGQGNSSEKINALHMAIDEINSITSNKPPQQPNTNNFC